MSRTTDLRRRPSGSKDERRSYLILCEGKTEKLYFTGMRTRLGPELAVDAPGGSHVEVVREAVRRCVDEYDEVWCVLDTELDGDLIERIQTAASEARVDLALSAPSFETWLLLHLKDCASPFASAEQAKKALAVTCPGWSEARTRFADFRKGVDDACDRARKLHGGERDPRLNPFTDVWRLVESILR
ncbi:RloB family protein [Actinomadura harenae]|uniref:RloB family protein n=1 Tax=Actinomadura harenae TaxID=2483351 RepID=UPI00131557E4|nr:RloB family protein [Actinomadura harenae]